jgi:hypothetical protein
MSKILDLHKLTIPARQRGACNEVDHKYSKEEVEAVLNHDWVKEYNANHPGTKWISVQCDTCGFNHIKGQPI